MYVSQTRLKDHLDQVIGIKHHENEEAENRLKEVEQYMVKELVHMGWEVSRQKFSFDTLETAWGSVHTDRYGTNLIAERQGSSEQVLIVATHHDTVPGSPGADDNGTGIAALLEIARLLKGIENYYTIRLISFDLEEVGLLGSEYYVQQLDDKERDAIVGVVMLEMLGYYTEEEQDLPPGFGVLYHRQIKNLTSDHMLRGDFLTCIYRGMAKHIAHAFEKTTDEDAIKVAYIRDAVDIPVFGRIIKRLVPSLQNLLRSDHTPFWMRNIPAVMMTDTSNFRYEHYHLPSDTIDKINFEEFTRATQRVLNAVLYLDENFR